MGTTGIKPHALTCYSYSSQAFYSEGLFAGVIALRLKGGYCSHSSLSFAQLDTVRTELTPQPISAYSLPSSAVNLASKMLHDSQF